MTILNILNQYYLLIFIIKKKKREHAHKYNQYACILNAQYSLPLLILMVRLPLSTVQPRRAWAAVTESTVFTPVHSLGHRPVHGAQFNLNKQQQRLWIKTEAWRRSKQITTAFYTCIRHDVRSWQRFSRLWLPRDKHIVPCPIKSHVTCKVVFVVFGTSPNALEWIVCWNTAVHLNGTGQRGHNPAETQLNTTDSCVGFEVRELRMRPVWRHDSGDEAFWCKNRNCTEKLCGKI